MVFFSPQASLVNFLRGGGGAKPWYFKALEAMPYRPQKFHCRSKIPFLGICRGAPYLANKIRGIHHGRKKK
jgi:glutamine amidotransferase-like uncharacterized protein